MRPRALWISFVLALLIAAPARASTGLVGPARATTGFVGPARATTGSFGPGSWCWFADPRAVQVTGQYNETFVGWIDWAGHVEIGAYDPEYGVQQTHTIATLFHDDHSSPTILVEPDKRLTVFYSAHNGSKLDFRSTLRPEDISAWGPVQQINSSLPGRMGYTYPNPVLLPAEGDKLYLFWRGHDYGQAYATRTLDGRWSAARPLIDNPGQRPYVKVASNNRDLISFAFTNGHPREGRTSVYYAAYRAGSLWTAGGRRIIPLRKAPIAPAQGDVVYNGQATGISSWVWDVALDSRERPVIVYATFPTPRTDEYWYAHWTGRRWVSHFMTFGGPSISPGTIETQYSGGLALDHANPSIVFLSRKVRGAFEIERWTTSDGGYRWRHTTVVRGGGDNVRPVVPSGWDGGPMGLVWLRGDYRTYTTYRTSIAFQK